MAKPKHPSPPPHLAPATQQWWRQVVRDFELESYHLRLLQLAGEAWDRAQMAREAIAREGITVPTETGGLKSHPAIGIERDSAIRFARILRELGLDAGNPADTSRPPHLRHFSRGS